MNDIGTPNSMLFLLAHTVEKRTEFSKDVIFSDPHDKYYYAIYYYHTYSDFDTNWKTSYFKLFKNSYGEEYYDVVEGELSDQFFKCVDDAVEYCANHWMKHHG